MSYTIISTKTPGHGRGKLLGFPTINLLISEDVKFEHGVYAVWVEIENKKYQGAMHFGPVPVFNELKPTLEVFLLDTHDKDLPEDLENIPIKITTVKKLRDVMSFPSPEDLIKQIEKDVQETREALSLHSS